MRNLLCMVLGLAVLCGALLIGCTTTTTTGTDGSKTVVHKLDAETVVAINAAVLEALKDPTISNAIYQAVAPK